MTQTVPAFDGELRGWLAEKLRIVRQDISAAMHDYAHAHYYAREARRGLDEIADRLGIEVGP